jgi:hypothetical protein
LIEIVTSEGKSAVRCCHGVLDRAYFCLGAWYPDIAALQESPGGVLLQIALG